MVILGAFQMSEYRVGIIAEGKTDIYLIEGILICAFPEHRFIFQLISPTEGELFTGQKKEGFGWRGVYKACCEFASRWDLVKTGNMLDLLVVHLDGDVAYAEYQQANIEKQRQDLPCAMPGDSIETAGEKLQQVVCDWLETVGKDKPVIAFCLPFINTEAWVGYLAYPEYRKKFTEKSLEDEIYTWLIAIGKSNRDKLLRNKGGRVRKIPQSYRRVMDAVTAEDWEALKTSYVQARRFASQLSQWNDRQWCDE